MNKIFYILFSLFVYASCEKIPASFPISDILQSNSMKLPEVSVEGIITSELQFQEVILWKPQQYTDSGNIDLIDIDSYYHNTRISGAIVSVEKNGKEYSYIESVYHSEYPEYKKQKGLYVSVEKIQGIPGKNHTLHVVCNGNSYSATDSMVQVNPITSFAELIGKPTGDSSLYDNYIGFGVDYAYIAKFIIHDTLYNYVNWEIDSTSFTEYDNIMHNYFFSFYTTPAIMQEIEKNNTIVSYMVQPDTEIHVKKISVSDAYQSFLLSVVSETELQYSDFRLNPANVPTNVTNGGIGFFAACDVDNQTTTFRQLINVNKTME